MKTPIPREWIDRKSGKIYWRVRVNNSEGKEVVKVFGTEEEAKAHIKTLLPARKLHGRSVAMNAEETAALTLWRQFVAGELTAGRDAPELRDVLKPAIERLRDGQSTIALEELRKQFEAAKSKKSAVHVAALKNRLARFVSYFDKEEPAGSVTTEAVEQAILSMEASLSSQTVKGVRSAAHGMFAWGLKRKLIKHNPVSATEAVKVLQGEVGVFTPSQLGGLLRTALEVLPRAVPALAIWAFCGVRRAEVNRLRFSDMDNGRAELRVSSVVAKSDRVRYVPMPPVLIAWLEAATAAGIAPLGKLVPGDNDKAAENRLVGWLRKIRIKAGLSEWPNNALRHSFSSYACALTDDYHKVAAWIGHSGGIELLVARYRHAVPKDAGEEWFNVFPNGYSPPKAKPQPRKKQTA